MLSLSQEPILLLAFATALGGVVIGAVTLLLQAVWRDQQALLYWGLSSIVLGIGYFLAAAVEFQFIELWPAIPKLTILIASLLLTYGVFVFVGTVERRVFWIYLGAVAGLTAASLSLTSDIANLFFASAAILSLSLPAYLFLRLGGYFVFCAIPLILRIVTLSALPALKALGYGNLLFLISEVIFILQGIALICAVAVQQRNKLIQTQLELEKAAAQAEQANRTKSQFLANMSHDLRTPLNAIIGFSDVIRQKTFGPLGNARYEEYVEDIHSSGEFVVSLVNDILDVSRIEAGKYGLKEEVLNLDHALLTCLRHVEGMAKGKGIQIGLNPTAPSASLLGDNRALIQIVTNLLSNSIKFSPEGGQINLSYVTRDDGGIDIRVQDTGIGMTMDQIEAAKIPFGSSVDTNSWRHKGTGLGLFICTELMKLFSGALEIESKAGEGTTVTLLFPASRTAGD